MRKCPNCGKEVKDNFNVCTNCGKKLITSDRKKEVKKDSSDSLGIFAGIIAIISILVLYKISAVIGMILYLIAFGIAITELKKDSEFNQGNHLEYCKSCFRKERFLSKGIPLIIVVLIPLIVIIAIYRWIYADTIRSVNNLYESMGGF